MNRLAVSVALSRRDRPDELLLVERNEKLRFFAGFLAFPGGTLDADDGEVPVHGLEDDALRPFVVAGARELFEETGILLARGGSRPDPDRLREDRKRLVEGNVSFRMLLEEYERSLHVADLAPLCRLTTPPFAPVRYETWFLRAWAPEDAEVEIWDGELVGGDFVDPQTALARWRNGELRVAPPMIMLLDAWSRGQEGLEERVRTIADGYERGRLHRIYFTPGILLVPLETPTQPPATHTNTCIIGEKRLYLVDPSPVDETERSRLWQLLDDLLQEGRELEGIVLTHYHPDHVGALVEMQRRYRVPAYAHADCMKELPNARFERPLEHGDRFDLGTAPDGSDGWKLVAYHVPGHARGHLAFQESRYGAIVVGDLVSTLSSILVDPRDGHLATYLRSLEFLETVTSGTLYPGHGPPAPNGRDVIRKTLNHRAEREEQLVATLSSEPQSARALVERIYTDVPRQMLGLAERSLLSGLIKLEEEGRARRVDDGYVLV